MKKTIFLIPCFIFNSCVTKTEDDYLDDETFSSKVKYINYYEDEIKFKTNSAKLYLAEFDLKNVNLKLVRAQNSLMGSERLSLLAKKNKATLAINGGFFYLNTFLGQPLPSSNINVCFPNNLNPYAAMPSRILKIENDWYGSSNGNFSSAVAWNQKKKEIVFGKIKTNQYLMIGKEKIEVDDLNKFSVDSHFIVYTPVWKKSIPFKKQGNLIFVENNSVTKIIQLSKQNIKNFNVPENGFLIYINKIEGFPDLKRGNKISLEFEISSENRSENYLWKHSDYILSGIPVLIKNRNKVIEFPKTQFYQSQLSRSAMCRLQNGKILFAVTSGADDKKNSLTGLSLAQLTDYLYTKGCIDAINLDGGKSSIMIFNKNIKNRSFPKDEEECEELHERAISDAIIVN